MSGYEESFQSLTRQVAATPGKRVLVVEGTTDVDFLTWMFDKPPLKQQNLLARWVIGGAGGKSSVLRMLQKKPKWIGLVDRDAWSEAEIQEAQRKTPNLFLLPRYCVENYLADPRLVQQLMQDPRYADRRDALLKAQARIERQYPHAIRHGSLWRAVQPLQDALQALGFNGALLRYSLPGDEEVKKTLIAWSDLMDWQRVYAVYQQAQERAASMTTGKAIAIWVHGKIFWRNVVSGALGEALGEDSRDRLARRLYRAMELPGDIEKLLDQMLHYQPKLRD